MLFKTSLRHLCTLVLIFTCTEFSTASVSKCTLNLGYLLCNNVSHIEFMRVGRQYKNDSIRNFLCNDCQLINLPLRFFQQWKQSLRGIFISNNRNELILEDFNFRGLYDLGALKLSGFKLLNLRPKVFRDLEGLSNLDLSRSTFSELPKNIFINLEGLTILNLAHGHINKLHAKSFEHGITIERLYLQGNRITHLPDRVFAPLLLLIVLDISKNPIVDLNYVQLPIPLDTMKVLLMDGLPCSTLKNAMDQHILPAYSLNRTEEACAFDKYKQCDVVRMTANEGGKVVVISSSRMEVGPADCHQNGIPCPKPCISSEL